jgi:hypothetical protein
MITSSLSLPSLHEFVSRNTTKNKILSRKLNSLKSGRVFYNLATINIVNKGIVTF